MIHTMFSINCYSCIADAKSRWTIVYQKIQKIIKSTEIGYKSGPSCVSLRPLGQREPGGAIHAT